MARPNKKKGIYHNPSPDSRAVKTSDDVNDYYNYNEHLLSMNSIPGTGLNAISLLSLQLCPTLCDPIDSSPPGSPIPGILQARTLEWVAISSPMHESEK